MQAKALTEAPIVGEYYNVLCLCVHVAKHQRWQYGHENRLVEVGGEVFRKWGKENYFHHSLYMPIIGTRHSDPDLGMPLEHIHYDFRFISPRYAKAVGLQNHGRTQSIVPISFGECSRALRPRRCWRSHATRYEAPVRLEADFLNVKMSCATCPHRGTSLGTVAPIDGTITCPAHGLVWDAKTGDLVPQHRCEEIVSYNPFVKLYGNKRYGGHTGA